ncbi:MAG TPA: bifunctional riboflavin kinase/FAD synthetase [Candidatus Manganitrophaceae bacterium]|nr:bifunctional riboflavin kinase/FAD synthetase [Candidatus Manganitrophaceae bacterium]
MKLFIGAANIKPNNPYPVVAVGNFDGVHLGHQAILQRTIERAREKEGTAVVLTFEPHPLKVLAPEKELRLLNTFQIKTRLIEATGVDVTFSAEFNKTFSQLSPYEFAKSYLHEKIGCKEVIVGRNFTFGKDRAGKAEDLIKFGKEFGFEVITVDPVLVDGIAVSSSKIRELIHQEGNVGLAGRMMGRYYSMEGKVMQGDGMGKKLGVPTANFRLPNELIPKDGVYAVRVATLRTEGYLTMDGVVYIGAKPTFDKKERRMEVHILDFNEDIYGKRLLVTFLEWIREDQKFETAEALVRQMGQDIEKARRVLQDKGPTP